MTTPTDEQKIERVAHTLLMTLGDLGQAGATNTLRATEHSGDCTKDAWTCLFCQANEYREAARAVVAKMQAIERRVCEKLLDRCPWMSWAQSQGLARAAIAEIQAIEREKTQHLMDRLASKGVTVNPDVQVTLTPAQNTP